MIGLLFGRMCPKLNFSVTYRARLEHNGDNVQVCTFAPAIANSFHQHMSALTSVFSSHPCARPSVCWISINKDVLLEFYCLLKLQGAIINAKVMGIYAKESGKRGRWKKALNLRWSGSHISRPSSIWSGPDQRDLETLHLGRRGLHFLLSLQLGNSTHYRVTSGAKTVLLY